MSTRYFETYLGDGAYAYLSDYREIVLYTSDGITETNTVVLEPDVLAMFESWLPRMKDALARMEKEREEELRTPTEAPQDDPD